MTNKKQNLKRFFDLITDLKLEFQIVPDINSIDELSDMLDKEITVKHLKCGGENKIILKKWLNLKKSPLIKDKNSQDHFCISCMNLLKKKDLEEYINQRYNNEFAVIGEFTGYKENIAIKHLDCGGVFYKTPEKLKANNKKLFCGCCKKSDSIYEQTVIDNRNKELSDRFEAEGVTTYTPLENCPGLTKKMKFKHLTCGHEFKSSAYDIYSYYNKHDHCPNCFKSNNAKSNPNKTKKDKEITNLKSKYRKFVQYSTEFDFYPKINSFDDFKEHFYSTFTITHKACGTTVKMTFSEWSKQRHYKKKSDNIPNFIHFCEYCSEKLNRADIQQLLDEKFNKEFKITSKYTGSKNTVEIEHISCGARFSIWPSNLRRSTLTCQECGNKDKKTEKLLQKKRNKELSKRLKDEGFKKFKPLEDSKGLSKLMKFEHTRCGSVIEITPYNLFKLKNKNYCSSCPERLLSQEEDINVRTELAQKALDLVNGDKFKIIGLYDDNTDSINLLHKDCLKEFPISKRQLFSKKIECPHCESNDFKNNRLISLNDKIKAYEEYLNNEYKILKPFLSTEDTVPIQHKKCGHIFERTISVFLRSQNKIFCPKCRHEEKLKEVNKRLYDKYKGEFEFNNLEEYKSIRGELYFIHKDCGTVFPSSLEKMLNWKTSPCPTCNENIKNERKFKADLYKRFKGEYLLVGKYEGHTKKTSFRHKKCNRLFIKTPYNVLNNDIPCSHCAKEEMLLGLKEAQERVRENSGDLFTLNGIYRGIKKDIPVTCNACKSVFLSTPKIMFLKKSCPECKATHL